MSRNNCEPYWSISASDLPYIKKSLEIILGDAVGASLRLEVFARMSGFRTYAALRSRLENFRDINGNSFPLRLDEHPAEDSQFFSKLSLEAKRKIARAEETGLVRLVVSALNRARHPVLGEMGIDDQTTIDDLRETAMNLFHPSQPRAREGNADHSNQEVALVLTPSNTCKTLGENTYLVYRFHFDGYRSIPFEAAHGDILLADTPVELAQSLQGREVYAYSTEDVFDIHERISNSSNARPGGFFHLKDELLYVFDGAPETPFLSAAELVLQDVEDEGGYTAEEQVMTWMLEMFCSVVTFQSESARELLAP